MNSEQYAVLLPVVSADLVSTIAEKRNITDQQAIALLYRSKLYEQLEREDTKLWHYSTPMLYSMLERELTGEKIDFPDV